MLYYVMSTEFILFIFLNFEENVSFIFRIMFYGYSEYPHTRPNSVIWDASKNEDDSFSIHCLTRIFPKKQIF